LHNTKKTPWANSWIPFFTPHLSEHGKNSFAMFMACFGFVCKMNLPIGIIIQWGLAKISLKRLKKKVKLNIFKN